METLLRMSLFSPNLFLGHHSLMADLIRLFDIVDRLEKWFSCLFFSYNQKVVMTKTVIQKHCYNLFFKIFSMNYN